MNSQNIDNFLQKEEYETIVKKLSEYKFSKFIENDYPFHKVWACSKVKYILENAFKRIGIIPQFYELFFKKIITEELKQSQHDTRYGVIQNNEEENRKFIIFFQQTNTGGVALFRHNFEKIPDIEFGAYPNRLVIFDNTVSYAHSHDFTYGEKIILEGVFQ